MIINKECVIIGGGPAGLAAAVQLKELGVNDIVLIEREKYCGGILNQCIHDGFGTITMGKSLTGPEYANIYIEELKRLKIEVMCDTVVTNVNPDKTVTAISPDGVTIIKSKAIILAMGCRERTRGAINISGTRPSGIYTAGTAQQLVNIKNIMVGKDIVILGSGDIGLIMARRLTLEGANVIAVIEKMPYSNGLPRNIVQCLEDFEIPLLLGYTVTNIEGENRVESIDVCKVDELGEPILDSVRKINCDTLILSVGLIPENEVIEDTGIQLSEITQGTIVDENLQTSSEGIFACGNTLHVHDLVDYVTQEAEKAAKAAANYIRSIHKESCEFRVVAGENVRYVIPNKVSLTQDITLSFRVTKPVNEGRVIIRSGENEVKSFNYKKLNPSEMVRISVPKELLMGGNNLEVVVNE